MSAHRGKVECAGRLAILPESDFVVICCQWTPETTRLFDKDRFAAMKAGGLLINVARGEIVDEEALADALQRDHLRGTALDVYVGEFDSGTRGPADSAKEPCRTGSLRQGSSPSIHDYVNQGHPTSTLPLLTQACGNVLLGEP